MRKIIYVFLAVALVSGAASLWKRAESSHQKVGSGAPGSKSTLRVQRDGESLSLYEKLSDLIQGGPVAEQKTRLLVAGSLRELFAKNDKDGLAELDKFISENILPGSFIVIGADFIKGAPEDKRREALLFLEGLQSYPGRDIVIGGSAKAIVDSPNVGTDVFHEIARDWEIAREVPGEMVFSDLVWHNVGRFLVESSEVPQLKALLFQNMAPQMRQNFHSGLSQGLRESVNAGDTSRMENLFRVMDSNTKAELSMKIAHGDFEINESNVAAFQKLLPVLTDAGAIDSAGYARMGKGLSEEAFDAIFLHSSAMQITHEMASMVKGWVAKRPKSSVEKFFDAGATEILRPGFQSWMEVDSIEASGWLASKPAGRERDICIEELCGYLLTKGAEEEAKAWLLQLPSESQEQLKEKYGSD